MDNRYAIAQPTPVVDPTLVALMHRARAVRTLMAHRGISEEAAIRIVRVSGRADIGIDYDPRDAMGLPVATSPISGTVSMRVR